MSASWTNTRILTVDFTYEVDIPPAQMARGNSRASSESPLLRNALDAINQRYDTPRAQALAARREAEKKKQEEYNARIEALGKENAKINTALAKDAGITTEWQSVDLKKELPNENIPDTDMLDKVKVRLTEDGRFEIGGSAAVRFNHNSLDKGIPTREAIMKVALQRIREEVGVSRYYAENPDENPGG